MNRFVIVDGLPYLLAHGKTYAVRWDEKGFTVGAEVKLASVPSVTYSALSILAKCAGHLDSMSQGQQEGNLSDMTIAELKAYAKAHGIDIGEARKKADILAAIEHAQPEDVIDHADDH